MSFINSNQGEQIIIGIDHGYGNIKTAHTCFKAGVTAHEKEPTFKSNMLVYDGRFYTIEEGHKEFCANKVQDNDYYILTLAAVARELELRGTNTARVHIAAGLPLTWVSEQKDAFKQYLLQKQHADFSFRGDGYHVDFTGADIFPQGYAAIVDRTADFDGVNMIADIGNGTMNIMFVNDCRPQGEGCFTEKFGTQQCMIAVREKVLKLHGSCIPDALIERVLREGTARLDEKYLMTIRNTASEYVAGVFRRLREHGYDPALMRLYVVGGGGCLVKHFGQCDAGSVSIIEDISATAKGYERLAQMRARKNDGVQ